MSTRQLPVVGAIIPAKINVDRSGFTIRPGQRSGAELTYGLMLRNESPNQDAYDITVLVNMVDDTNRLWGSKSTKIVGIPAGQTFAMGDALGFAGPPPVTRLEVVIQVAGRAPAAKRPVFLDVMPTTRDVVFLPDSDPQWVGAIKGELITQHARLILARTRLSAVVLDHFGNVVGGARGTSSAALPPGARVVFSMTSAVTGVFRVLKASGRSDLVRADVQTRAPAAFRDSVAAGQARGQTRCSGRAAREEHSAQRGARARHTRRPCQMSRCGKRPQSARGTSRIRSRSIFTGSSRRVSPRRCESRRTCVSTTTPCGLPELRRHHVRRLARHAGEPHQLLDRARHLAPELLQQRRHRPAQRARLLPEEARGVDVALELLGRHGQVVLRPPVLAKQPLRHAVDVHVGRLRREHHRHEQLERVAEAQRDLRVGVLVRRDGR